MCFLLVRFISVCLLTSEIIMQICLSFYEVKNKQPSWFTNKIERLYWEQWYVNLNVARLPKAHSNKSHHSKVVFDPGGTETVDLTSRIFDVSLI